MLRQFLESELRDQKQIDAYIEHDNLRSVRCFTKAGFEQVAEKPDEDEMLKFSFLRKAAQTPII
jgi:L-amino acid N-acyltransferase YncA